MSKKNAIITVILVAVIVIAGAGIWFWMGKDAGCISYLDSQGNQLYKDCN